MLTYEWCRNFAAKKFRKEIDEMYEEIENGPTSNKMMGKL